MLVLVSHDVLRCDGCGGAWHPDSGVTSCPMETCPKAGKKLIEEAVPSVTDVDPEIADDVAKQPEVVTVFPEKLSDATKPDLTALATALDIDAADLTKPALVSAIQQSRT